MSGFTGQPGSINYPLYMELISKTREVTGRAKASFITNVFEADFEYGMQPLRWEVYTAGGGTAIAQSGQGGVQMSVTAAAGDLVIRQSRPYHRYQPGKTMAMATAINFGGAVTGQRQRVGFFDDGNGIFWQQAAPTAANPSGMQCVVRSDVGGIPLDTVFDYTVWSDPDGIKGTINWSCIQMLYIEYAWYGGGGLRWGVLIDGEPHILHHVATGNVLTVPWSRTGNLPVRYELRNLAAAQATSMYHYGVSVLVDGGQDPQRGFTYSYGMALGIPARTVAAGSTRYPLASVQYRPMGTQEFTQASAAITGTPTNTTLTVASLPAISSIVVSGGTTTVTFASAHGITSTGVTNPTNYLTISGATPAALNGYWPITVVNTTQVSFATPFGATTATVVGTATPWTAGQWVGKYIFFPGLGSGLGTMGRITANTANTLTYCDNVTSSPQDGVANGIANTPSAGGQYIIGVINRGLILPQFMLISSTALCQVELIMSTPASPVVLTGSNFVALNTLGSNNSFATRDVSATALSGGESVMKFNAPAGGSGLQPIDLTKLFPLYNRVQGHLPDILTVAITTQTGVAATVGVDIIGQEQMS